MSGKDEKGQITNKTAQKGAVPSKIHYEAWKSFKVTQELNLRSFYKNRMKYSVV
jgi:hypothetical protein